MENEIWLDRQEAINYYGVASTTITNWVRSGKIKTKDAVHIGKRMMKLYLKDEDLKKLTDYQKAFDRRFK